jgi:outer membrane lipoprotein SlyB
MKRIAQSVLLAGLTAMALGACTSTGMPGDTARTTSTTERDYGSMPDAAASTSGAGATGSTGAAGATASGGTDQTSQSGVTTGAPNSTVTNIEVIPRQSGDAATGAGTVAGAAVGGSTGSSATSDRVYRITLRMDDGTERTITQESTPSFSSGDRVRLAGGAIVR